MVYSYFEKGCREKKCTRYSRKLMRDMISTLFLTTVAVEPTFVAFFQHSQTYIHGLSCLSFKFLCRRVNSNHPQYLSGLSRALFPTTFLAIAVWFMLLSACTYSKSRKQFLRVRLKTLLALRPHLFPVREPIHYCNKILLTDWLSAALILALQASVIGQYVPSPIVLEWILFSYIWAKMFGRFCPFI